MEPLRPVPTLPAHLLANARLLRDRLAILPLIPKRKVIAEVGVALGDFSQRLLQVCEPSRFIAIDLFDLHTKPELWGRPAREIFGGKTHLQCFQERFADAINDGTLSLLEGDSAARLAALDDDSLDIVYVDADHGYGSVRRDLAALRPKVRPDGWIILNDYVMSEAIAGGGEYGVVHATNEFMITHDWEMIYFAFQVWMYCDVVLRRRTDAPVAVPEPGAVERYCARLEASNARLEASNGQLEASNADLRGALETVYASTSWRITGPLRALGRSLPGGAGRRLRRGKQPA